ncbi:hypothetical protein FOA52_001706 [Chlamydomonas sp. UWO 241]|nr:hypothetical protein FOA52_001706 [Chlamydomonas sp. UWO 241]
MGAQALANSVHAVAKLGYKDDAFMAELVKAATLQLRDFKPQELANTVWALATLGHTGDDFVVALVKAATPQLHFFNPQDLANTAWALATLGHTDTAFMAALLEVAMPKLRKFSEQSLANTVWALTTLGHKDGDFVAALLKEAMPRLHDFTPQALANTLWALATLGHADDDFVAELLNEAMPRLHDFNPQALSNTAWALAVLGHANDALMGALLQHAAGMVLGFSAEGRRQLFLCMLWLKGQHSDVAVHAQLAAACERAWMEERDDPQSPHVQLQVLAVVRQLPGCSGAVSEQATDDGLFNIDIAVQLPDGSRLAVEVDGPSHFLSNQPGTLGGATLLRNWLLEARGWRVVSVPVRTGWEPLAKQGKQARRDYLLSLGVGSS